MKLVTRRRAGITFTELLVSVSVIAVLISLSFVLLQTADRFADRLDEKVARFSAARRQARYKLNRRFDLTKKVPNQYVVTFHKSVQPHQAAAELAKNVPAQILHVYKHVYHGAAVRIQPGLLPALLAQPSVAEVRQDQYVYPAVMPTGIRRIRYVMAPKAPPQRIYFPPFVSAESAGGSTRPINMMTSSPLAGNGATKAVAVIDTGIDSTNPELNVARSVAFGWPSGEDQTGHGTHVSGTIGARGLVVAGVFPGVPLWSVRVLGPQDEGGTTSDVIGGIDYVAANADQVSVANMSLGGGFFQPLNDAVDACTGMGVVMCVAAGNFAIDASQLSPASAPTAICVAAMCDTDGRAGHLGHPGSFGDPDDTFTSFSDFGTTVAIIAPGEDILSTWPVAMGSYNTISGTSMATPHVSGMSALVRASPGIILPSGRGATNTEGTYVSNGIQTPALVRAWLLNETVELIPGLAANGDSLNYQMLAGRP